MPIDPSFHATSLGTSRPYSPSLRQHNDRSPGLSTGSATQIVTSTLQRSASPEPLVLRLRGAHSPQSDSADDQTSTAVRRRRPRIQWAEDVIDNEGLGRKKSKVCCIYHKPRAVGESSDESSSDSSSSSDNDSDDSDGGRDGARPIGGSGKRGRGHAHEHGNRNGDDDCGHEHNHENRRELRKSKHARRPSPNEYERMPKYDVKPLAKQPGTGS